MAEFEKIGSLAGLALGAAELSPAVREGIQEALEGRAVRWDGRPDDAPRCCNGTGYTRRDVLPGHPDFGKLFECTCDVAQARAKKRQERIWANAQVPPKMLGYTLETLAERPGKAELADLLRSWQQANRWLVMLGPKGTCKTGAAVALLLEHIRNGGTGMYIKPATFLQRIKKTYGDRDAFDEDEVIQPVIDTQFLVLDDIGTAVLTKWGQEKLFTIVDERDGKHLAGDPRITVVTSNLYLTAPRGSHAETLPRHLDSEERTWDRIRGWADEWVLELSGESQRGLELPGLEG